jgi:hypothetical protein
MKIIFVIAILTIAAQAQDVPPPPRPAGMKPPVAASSSPTDLDGTLNFIREKTLAEGVVRWTRTTKKTNEAAPSAEVEEFEQVTSFTANAGSCRLDIKWKASHSDGPVSHFYLEDLDPVSVIDYQRSWNQGHTAAGHPELVELITPAVYSLVVPGFDLKFATQAAANQVAAALRRAVSACQAVPPQRPGSGPTIEDTLTFIQDKMTAGPVIWNQTTRDPVAGTSSATAKRSFEVSGVIADPHACRLEYRWKLMEGDKVTRSGTARLSLKRVDKIEVMTMADLQQRYTARSSHPELVVEVQPEIAVLLITRADQVTFEFPFYDRDTAERLAKAMLHAVELCGGGRDPF